MPYNSIISETPKQGQKEPKYYTLRECEVCGNEFKSTVGVHKRRFCPSCIEKRNAYFEELGKEQMRIKLILMHESALKKLECCANPFQFDELRDAIKAIEEMEKLSPESFLSASEILAAIGLYHQGFFFKINHKIGNYKVDFYLPDEKICIEIDSSLHDVGNARLKDGRRDVDLRLALGAEWEIVRIGNTYSDKYPLSIGDKAIEIADKQRELRKKNNGMLPRGYSKSVDAYYKKVFD